MTEYFTNFGCRVFEYVVRIDLSPFLQRYHLLDTCANLGRGNALTGDAKGGHGIKQETEVTEKSISSVS
ncbi:MAG: hypothetical protein MJZ83_03110 [Bacteroidaceae bacterium]|nr:hypothetical protein [Bacteroidaceae bacterium]